MVEGQCFIRVCHRLQHKADAAEQRAPLLHPSLLVSVAQLVVLRHRSLRVVEIEHYFSKGFAFLSIDQEQHRIPFKYLKVKQRNQGAFQANFQQNEGDEVRKLLLDLEAERLLLDVAGCRVDRKAEGLVVRAYDVADGLHQELDDEEDEKNLGYLDNLQRYHTVCLPPNRVRLRSNDGLSLASAQPQQAQDQ